MTSDIEALSGLLHSGLINLVAQFLKLTFIVGILLSFNVQLTLILIFAAAPFMLGLTTSCRGVSRKGYEVVRNRIAAILADLQESLSGIRLIIFYDRMKHNIIHHRNIVSDYRPANIYTAKIGAAYGAGTAFVQTASRIVLLICGYFILVDVNPTLDPDGAFSIGALIAFNSLVVHFF